MLLIGVSGSLIFYLQAIKIFYMQTATAVSLPAFVLGLISVFSWMVYGILIKNKVLFISNLWATIGAALVVVVIFIYRT